MIMMTVAALFRKFNLSPRKLEEKYLTVRTTMIVNNVWFEEGSRRIVNGIDGTETCKWRNTMPPQIPHEAARFEVEALGLLNKQPDLSKLPICYRMEPLRRIYLAWMW